MTSTTLVPTIQPTASDRSDTYPPTAANIAGIGYVFLFVFTVFANLFVREGLVVTDDAQTTAANIGESEGLFRQLKSARTTSLVGWRQNW